jgi:hypothetical protein
VDGHVAGGKSRLEAAACTGIRIEANLSVLAG